MYSVDNRCRLPRHYLYLIKSYISEHTTSDTAFDFTSHIINKVFSHIKICLFNQYILPARLRMLCWRRRSKDGNVLRLFDTIQRRR